jgi:predicted phosphodiesterase/DMSO/TMAO reductase YedYZ molybdopterin-dependent catalytic subunit
MKAEGNLNKKALVAVILVIIMLLVPLAYLYSNQPPEEHPSLVTVIYESSSEHKSKDLSLQDLSSMNSVQAYSSYQNYFGNWRGQGVYKGVLISDMIKLVGTMNPGDNLTIKSTDGYNQSYSYKNVYNAWPDPSVQGDMILAYSFNGTSVPDWKDGPMVAFLPKDGNYSNLDCLNTSSPGQGGRVYLSGGARWVKTVASITLNAYPTNFTFAIVGDSEGDYAVFNSVLEGIKESNVSFAIHLGDIVSSPNEGQMNASLQQMHGLGIPFYTTPGNHDVQGNSTMYYKFFGPGDYYFDRGGYRFVSLDTSTGFINETQFSWLIDTLKSSLSEKKIVFTHIPPFDPRGEGHCLFNESQAQRFMSIVETYNVTAVLTGHIHIYNYTRVDSVDYIISGGGGGDLYATPEMGGFYHYVLFTANETSISFRPIPVEAHNEVGPLLISGKSGNVTLTLTQILGMPYVEGNSSFQNFYGNWEGQGTYRGVLISDLVELVRGMGPNDTLIVNSSDGYVQEYSYWNVYPNSTWLALQGPMILAYSFNGTEMPAWQNGPQIAFIPSDGAYSNQDCLATSAPGQGGHVYLSGGARWAKYVTSITVLSPLT